MAEPRIKVVLLNHSDSAGGASVVTYRLMNALCAEGVDARMVVVHKESDSLRVDRASGQRKAHISFLKEHLAIFLGNGFKKETVFKISTAAQGLPLWDHPWVKEADVVMLNWVNQGMLALEGVRKIARTKPVIWTMHDLWNMTGVCHVLEPQAWGLEKVENEPRCAGYANGCEVCPLVGKGNLAAKVFRRKQQLYSSTDIHFVAVSRRLAELCRQSPLLSDADITVIPNAIPVERFGIEAMLRRREIGVPEGMKLVVMGAARLDDPVKNLPLAIESLNRVTTPKVAAVFFGELRDPVALEAVRIPYVWLGKVTRHDVLQTLMANAEVVLSTSLWETLPGTIVEGIAAGAVGVATDNGGQTDIIDDGVTGFLVKNPTPEHMAAMIDSALELPFTKQARLKRHHMMAQRFGAPAVANAYIKLIKRIMA